MAYLVLARKYRPETFADMVGQDHVTRTLKNAIKADRVHHAYLFCGVRGLGKTTAARILAKALVCERGPAPEPCNECSQCTAVNEGRSVDVIEIDGASNNSVEDVRSLREQVHFLPQSARRKIYIIDEVHMLTASAFNALLKTLEEPPEHVTFLFATTDPQKVLPTILSRVSRLDLRRVSQEALVGHLQAVLAKEGVAVDDEGLSIITRTSEGSVRDAMTLLDKVIAFAEDPSKIEAAEVRRVLGQADRFAVAQLLGAVLARDADATLQRFDELSATTSDLVTLAISILQHLRDLTVLKMCNDPKTLLGVSEGLEQILVDQAAGQHAMTLSQLFDRFSRVLDGLDQSRAPRLVIEMGLLDLVHAEPLVPISELIARLDGAQGSGGSGGGRQSQAPVRDGARPQSRQQDRQAKGHPQHAQPPQPREPRPQTAQPPQPQPDRPHPDRAQPAPPPAQTPRQQPAARTNGSAPRGAARPANALTDKLWSMLGETPAPSDADDFSLEPAPEGEPPPPPRSEPAPADAGCPSSRCTPREPIAWQRLEPFEAWEELLERIRAEDELLYAVLLEFGLSHLDDQRLALAMPSGSFARRQWNDQPQLKASLVAFAQQALGNAPAIELIDATPCLPGLPSLALVLDKRRDDLQESIEGDARANPQIRALMDQLGASLTQVRPLGS